MAKVAILGLGESLSLYDKDRFDLSIGCNDIWSRVKTDYVVCVDEPTRFSPERLRAIQTSEPISFYSHLNSWSERGDFIKITLQSYYPSYICDLDVPDLPKSLCSPFVACAVAYKFHSPSEIHLFGVDLITHPHLSKNIERIKLHFLNLKRALNGKGILLIVHGNGALSEL